MLRWRLLSAGMILGLLLSLAVLDYRQAGGAPPGTWLLGWLLLTVALATDELLSLFAAKELRPVQWPVYVGTIGLTLAFAWPVFEKLWPALSVSTPGTNDPFLPMVALAAVGALVLFVEIRRFHSPGPHVVHIALSVFAIVYLGVLGGFQVALRLTGDNHEGMTALVSAVFVIKMSDVGAYGFGRLLGANKLAPRLSPGKTIEGAIGGIAMGCVASWAFFRLIWPQLVPNVSGSEPSYVSTMLYGLILAVAAMIGDLAESLLKRDMGRKDSSTRLPGLGGVLDVIDSLLVGAPAAYVCWTWGLM